MTLKTRILKHGEPVSVSGRFEIWAAGGGGAGGLMPGWNGTVHRRMFDIEGYVIVVATLGHGGANGADGGPTIVLVDDLQALRAPGGRRASKLKGSRAAPGRKAWSFSDCSHRN